MSEPRELTARIRMYRQGLGDCHLLTLMDGDDAVFRMMIDCGVYQTVSGGADKMRQIVADVIAESGGRIDVLVVTHEHWDHVSGFNQARQLFCRPGDAPEGRLSVDQVWMGWTEDPDDPLARSLMKDRTTAIRRVAAAHDAAKRLGASTTLETGLDGILGFFGGASRTTADAMGNARALVGSPRYCRPDDGPVRVVPGARIYVLGPPRDPEAINRLVDDGETYHLLGRRGDDAIFGAIDATDASADALHADVGQPFDWAERRAADFRPRGSDDASNRVDIADAGTAAFLERHYFGLDPEAADPDQSWRRIDSDWLESTRDLALKLDNATNNTSLVVAIELERSGKVLLFAADAQVGSWLTWSNLEWTVAGEKVLGENLIARTAFLKVGHHGSHNATLRRKGLEIMSDDLVAFVPTDEEMAKKVGWGRMPLPSLLKALEERTGGRTLRADKAFTADGATAPKAKPFKGSVKTTDLYYELDLG